MRGTVHHRDHRDHRGTHPIADDEKVVTRKTFEGTHRGEFMGVPPRGRPVAFEVIDILTVRDRKILEHRVVFDSTAIQAQLTA
ncbi:MAG TPA: ester cyclase [Thermoanaerobaculia bacterium]